MNNSENGKWHLAFVVGELKEGEIEPTTKINAIEPICHKTLAKDRKIISEYHSSLQLVKSVQLNMQQFLEAVVHYSADFLETEDMSDDKFDSISMNFSRLMLNILSMFRSLLDHSNFSLSREFGKESDQLKKWKSAQSEQYDSLFEYRLFYKLRNYCQHVGMPPMQISFSNSAEQEGIGFRLDLLRDKLLEEKDSWNKQLTNDLKTAPEKIPVIEGLDKWSKSFHTLSKLLLDLKRDAALCAAQKIINHRERLNLPLDVGKLCAIFLPNTEKKPNKLNLLLNWLPENHAKEIISNNFYEKD